MQTVSYTIVRSLKTRSTSTTTCPLEFTVYGCSLFIKTSSSSSYTTSVYCLIRVSDLFTEFKVMLTSEEVLAEFSYFAAFSYFQVIEILSCARTVVILSFTASQERLSYFSLLSFLTIMSFISSLIPYLRTFRSFNGFDLWLIVSSILSHSKLTADSNDLKAAVLTVWRSLLNNQSCLSSSASN